MPTMSIEILCAGATKVDLSDFDEIGVDSSHPPKSDRKPSLWQSHINNHGGVLVHLFDPSRKGEDRRWAYDIVEERDWKDFKFKVPVRPLVFEILRQLVDQSPSGKVYFYSDAQWSNDALVVDNEQSLTSFFSHHDSDWVRMNTAFGLVAG